MKNAFIITYVIILLFLPTNRLDLVFSTSQLEVTAVQNSDDSYQRREDQYDLRKEGILKERRIKVNSDRITLLSAKIITDTLDTKIMPEILHLGFYMKEDSLAEINISYHPSSYYLDSIEKNWGPGFEKFTWPSDILRKHLRDPNLLYARVVRFKKSNRKVFPATIYTNEIPTRIQAYKFIVAPLRDMSIEYWILDHQTEKVLISVDKRKVAKDENFPILWDCRNNQGDAVSEGDYVLKLTGTFYDKLMREKKRSISYQFHHKINLKN